MKSKINLKSLSNDEMIRFMEKLEQKPYRARQIIKWIYKNLASSIDDMSNLSIALREELSEIAYVSNLKLLKKQTSKDGSQKFLFGLEDGESIECVLMPEIDRLTICISSQVGCAMVCRFCNTGMLGLKRNMKAYEISDQIISIMRLILNDDMNKPEQNRRMVTNIVLMGMGEPLENADEVLRALHTITDNIGISKRRITLSTAGIIPGIKLLAKKGPDVNLAISLNAATDRTRSMIMPINRKYPLKDLISLCREFPLSPGRRITFEYILLDGINDSEDDSMKLLTLLQGIKCKINLIPYNEVIVKGRKPNNLRRTSDEKILRFQKVLEDSGVKTIIRKSRGSDISAACGQLRSNYRLTH
jgi:23S rRNA (adenine2503-C2)-methyltransferase